MGLAYERSVGFRKDFHAHDRPMIVFPRGSCVMRVRTAADDRMQTHTIDSTAAFIVPRRVPHEDESVNSIFDTLALFPAPTLVAAVANGEGIARATGAQTMTPAQTLRRGLWLEQLAQEYVFARVVSRRESAKTLAFFERQLLVEILASGLRRVRTLARSELASGDTVTGRALRYIEANLFSDISL